MVIKGPTGRISVSRRYRHQGVRLVLGVGWNPASSSGLALGADRCQRAWCRAWLAIGKCEKGFSRSGRTS